MKENIKLAQRERGGGGEQLTTKSKNLHVVKHQKKKATKKARNLSFYIKNTLFHRDL